MKKSRTIKSISRQTSASVVTARKTVLAVAVAGALGISTGDLRATTYEMELRGVFTMIGPAPTGSPIPNQNVPAYTNYAPFNLNRTPFKGVMTYDDVAKTGQILNMTGTVDATAQGHPNGFYFFGKKTPAQDPVTNNLAIAHGVSTNSANPSDPANIPDPISFTNIGKGGTNTTSNNLLLANMVFYWNGGNHFVPIVWDATGMVSGLPADCAAAGKITGGVVPASDLAFGAGVMQIGPAPIATTTWNPTSLGDPKPPVNTFPFADVPLTDDGIGGAPMDSPGFGNHNANFDFQELTVTKVGGVSCAVPPPSVQSTAPQNGVTGVNENVSPTISFNVPLKVSTVTPANVTITNVATNAPVAATVSVVSGSTILIDPTISLEFNTQYRVDVSNNIQGVDNQPLAQAFASTFTVRPVPVDTQVCTAADQRPDDPVGSNFTMLNDAGEIVGGTNDITYTLDFQNLNTTINGITGISTNVMKSAVDFPFFGFAWTAHHIRLFGPGQYDFNTGCTGDELQAGTSPAACAINGPIVSMTVGANQVGAHMLFDWNNRSARDIDVAIVWDKNKAWADPDEVETKNDIYLGASWAGPAGLGVDPDAIYQYVSTDNEPDGVIGIPMGPGGPGVDSPFAGFNASFNLGPDRSCIPIQPAPQQASPTAISKGFFGCSLTDGKVAPWQRADLGVLAGFIGLLAFWRRRNRTGI